MVKINGNTELKYLKADKLIYDSVPSRLALEFVNSDSAFNFYYPITISVNRCATGTYRLRSLGAIIDISPISVDKLCCYTNPDQSYWNYVTYEPDSLDNYIKLTVDSINNTAYGLFKATLIPFNGLPSDGPDTIRLSCDTFYCKYSTIIH